MGRGVGQGWSVGFCVLMGLVAVGDGIAAILDRSWILGILSFVFLALVIVQGVRLARRNRVSGPSGA